jgi:hypothetical protein
MSKGVCVRGGALTASGTVKGLTNGTDTVVTLPFEPDLICVNPTTGSFDLFGSMLTSGTNVLVEPNDLYNSWFYFTGLGSTIKFSRYGSDGATALRYFAIKF